MRKDFVFTSESVTEGHPDKLCDLISDAIVDRFLQQDPCSGIIAECAVSTAILFIAARFATTATVDIPTVARRVISQIGYDQPAFSGKTCSVLTSLKELPTDERLSFDELKLSNREIDRVAVRNAVTAFGFACDQTPALMPLPITLAHRLAMRLTDVRREKIVPYLTPDASVQVGVEYRDRQPSRVHSITILASQDRHAGSGGPDLARLQTDVRESVVDFVFREQTVRPDNRTRVFINSDGALVVGGPSVHSGVTGRKIAVDTYGQYARTSGAALSGKDPTRIDRIATYAARYAAKNVVASGLASECEVQLSYSVGLPGPVSLEVETFGTGSISDDAIARLLREHFDFRLAAILKQFRLRLLPARESGGFYSRLGAYGHVGRTDLDLPWETIDKAPLLRELKPAIAPAHP